MTSSSKLLIPLLAVLAGCSDDSGSNDTNDVPVSDAGHGTDSASSIPRTWPVHVEVVDLPANTEPLSVLVSTVDGTKYDLVDTDASGKATVTVPDLGAVTVFQNASSREPAEGVTVRYARSFNLVDEETILRVPLGLGPTQMEGQPGLESITFTADPATLPPGTDEIRVQLPCIGSRDSEGGPTNPVTFDAVRLCSEASEYFAVALALDTSGKALAAAVLEHLPGTPGAKAHTLAFDNTTSFTNLEPSLAPVDTTSDDVSVSIAAFPPGSTYGKYAYLSTKAGLAHPIGTQKLVAPVVTSFFQEFQLTATIIHPNIPGVMSSRVDGHTVWTSTFPPSFDLDVTGLAPLESASNEISTTVERPYVTFSLGEGELGSCVGGKMAWLDGSQEAVFWSWDANVESSGMFQVPELPASLSSFAPTVDSSILEWGGGVWHAKGSHPCGDLTHPDTQTRGARGPVYEPPSGKP